MFWLAQLERNTKIPAYKWAGLDKVLDFDDPLILAFELAIAYRLKIAEDKIRIDNFEALGMMISRMFGGDPEAGDRTSFKDLPEAP